MKLYLCLIAILTLLLGCATDPTLAPGVKRHGNEFYSVSQLGVGLLGDITTQAVQQCQMEGKNLNIVSSTTQTGISGASYPKIIFRCD